MPGVAAGGNHKSSMESKRVRLSYSSAGASAEPAENRKPRIVLSLSPKPSSARGMNRGSRETEAQRHPS